MFEKTKPNNQAVLPNSSGSLGGLDVVELKKENQNVSSQNIPSKLPAVNNIKMHTMQDDADALDGKITALQATEKGDSKSFSNIFKPDNKIKPINSEQKSSEDQEKQISASNSVQNNTVSNSSYNPVVEKKIPVSNFQISDEKYSSKKTFLIIIAIILIFLIFATGGYYFWMTRQQTSEGDMDNNQGALITETTTTTEAPLVIIEPQPEKFSLDKPNYLRIDSANYNAEKVAALFSDTVDKLEQANISQPAEFLVVDEKNNPIDFASFSLFSGIKLPKTISDSLSGFSLYFYSDNGAARIGVAIKIKEGSDITKAVFQEEQNLASDLDPLQIEKAAMPQGKVFSSSIYKSVTIRYVNLNDQVTNSIDYAFMDKQWIIGTSKNSMHAILDKMINDKENATSALPIEESTTITSSTSTTTSTTIISLDSINKMSGQIGAD
jgi:hypothetical protein